MLERGAREGCRDFGGSEVRRDGEAESDEGGEGAEGGEEEGVGVEEDREGFEVEHGTQELEEVTLVVWSRGAIELVHVEIDGLAREVEDVRGGGCEGGGDEGDDVREGCEAVYEGDASKGRCSSVDDGAEELAAGVVGVDKDSEVAKGRKEEG